MPIEFPQFPMMGSHGQMSPTPGEQLVQQMEEPEEDKPAPPPEYKPVTGAGTIGQGVPIPARGAARPETSDGSLKINVHPRHVPKQVLPGTTNRAPKTQAEVAMALSMSANDGSGIPQDLIYYAFQNRGLNPQAAANMVKRISKNFSPDQWRNLSGQWGYSAQEMGGESRMDLDKVNSWADKILKSKKVIKQGQWKGWTQADVYQMNQTRKPPQDWVPAAREQVQSNWRTQAFLPLQNAIQSGDNPRVQAELNRLRVMGFGNPTQILNNEILIKNLTSKADTSKDDFTMAQNKIKLFAENYATQNPAAKILSQLQFDPNSKTGNNYYIWDGPRDQQGNVIPETAKQIYIPEQERLRLLAEGDKALKHFMESDPYLQKFFTRYPNYREYFERPPAYQSNVLDDIGPGDDIAPPAGR